MSCLVELCCLQTIHSLMTLYTLSSYLIHWVNFWLNFWCYKNQVDFQCYKRLNQFIVLQILSVFFSKKWPIKSKTNGLIIIIGMTRDLVQVLAIWDALKLANISGSIHLLCICIYLVLDTIFESQWYFSLEQKLII